MDSSDPHLFKTSLKLGGFKHCMSFSSSKCLPARGRPRTFASQQIPVHIHLWCVFSVFATISPRSAHWQISPEKQKIQISNLCFVFPEPCIRLKHNRHNSEKCRAASGSSTCAARYNCDKIEINCGLMYTFTHAH